ncbi:AraC family transcriptional regulator [Azospirillum sp.]|uniref:AraC family transcriptional regulator n=1 Tax=Azospirillum sp. TaxID=34012 RepID=UPI002D59BE32|nr:AraC family transcriptional regulator [Azospirillum sp.]HYD70767.1 AraC family transcriptional regulator [Azospirillum sp.]
MTKPATILDYSRRIDRVVEHIGTHLDEPLDLARLAEVACFSPYHFHRIYRAFTGETAADTLRRLRLHRAAGELVRSSSEVTAIARRAGYGSVEAFTRAFRQAYGSPPAAYRTRGSLAPPAPTIDETEDSMNDVTVRDLEPIRVAAIAHRGPYMEIGTAFARLSAWAAGRGLLGPNTRAFGVAYDDPDTVPAAELRSEACLAVGPEVEGEGDVYIREIPGGRHAVLLHKGPYAELHRSYRRLYRDWFPASGFVPADRPAVEEYLNDCRTLPPEEWLTEIRIPLA